MKTRTWMACLACIVVGFTVSTLLLDQSNGQDKGEKPGQPKWEHKIVRNPDSTLKRLNELGAEGWELVAVVASDGLEAFYLKCRVP